MPAGDRARAVLAALARGVLGPGYHSEIPDRMMHTTGFLAQEKDRRRLLSTIRALDSRPGALLLTGTPVPVSWRTPAEADRLVQRWKASRIPAQRRLAGAVITLAANALYGHPCREWDDMGYAGPLGRVPRTRKKLSPIEIDRDERLECDVVVVGSGAGGGCAAAALASAGLDVVVLEKGGYFSESDFHHREAQALHDLYLYGGSLLTTDLNCRVIAGSAVGGGTLVNYATTFHTPARVLNEWAQVSGVEAFASGEIADSLDEVAERIGVTTSESAPGRRDQLMEEGLVKLGWHVDPMPRGVRGCTQDANCGYCGFGCRPGAKQGTMKTFLEDATDAGARIFTRATIDEVVVDDGRAVGAKGTANGHELMVSARAVVVSCGSIETPALLLRSGLRGEVGKHLRLHPGTAPWGLFDEEVRIWEGTTQARYSKQFVEWDGGYGPLFETIPVHPGAGAAAFYWESAAQHRELMGSFDKISFCGVLARDSSEGRVRISKEGTPLVDYKIDVDDERRIAEGVVNAAKVLEAAGATIVHSPHPQPISYRPGPGTHERWAEEVRSRGFKKDVLYVSYHQMGSCRMGVDPSSSVVDGDNQSHEVRGLYVLDASTFPTASGVNPMLSIYGIANRGAKRLAQKLS